MAKNNLILCLSLLLVCGFWATDCSLIIGGSQEINYRSREYSIIRLDRDPKLGWHLLPSSHEQDKADMAFEHQPTEAIISVNSVCREYTKASLEELSKQLLIGVIKHGDEQKRNLQVDEVPALESTVEATLDVDKTLVQIRTIVLRKSNCIYDLMLIAKPEVFNERLPDFERFTKGFHAQ